MQTVVTPGHPAAAVSFAPSRDMRRNFGVGTARREEANMLPTGSMQVRLVGRTQPQWAQSRAVEHRGGVLPRSRAMDVVARSGNQDPHGVGLSRRGLWATAGIGDEPAAAAPAQGLFENISPNLRMAMTAALVYGIWRSLNQAGKDWRGH